MAAYASECAGRYGKTREFLDVLFTHQDSIGKVGWASLARRAGVAVRDTIKLPNCMKEKQIIDRVVADSAAGARIGVRGTPTVIINQWRLTGTPTFEMVDSIVKSLLPKNGA